MLTPSIFFVLILSTCFIFIINDLTRRTDIVPCLCDLSLLLCFNNKQKLFDNKDIQSQNRPFYSILYE